MPRAHSSASGLNEASQKSGNQDTRHKVQIATLTKLGYDLKMVTIGILKKATPSTLRDINRLLAILREDKGKTAGTISELRTILSDKNTAVVTVKDAERVIGMGTLYIVQKVGEMTGYVEDLVVDEDYRGQGFGEKIMKKLIATARLKKSGSINLTSRPSRVAAHKLYEKLGFRKRETDVYNLSL